MSSLDCRRTIIGRVCKNRPIIFACGCLRGPTREKSNFAGGPLCTRKSNSACGPLKGPPTSLFSLTLFPLINFKNLKSHLPTALSPFSLSPQPYLLLSHLLPTATVTGTAQEMERRGGGRGTPQRRERQRAARQLAETGGCVAAGNDDDRAWKAVRGNSDRPPPGSWRRWLRACRRGGLAPRRRGGGRIRTRPTAEEEAVVARRGGLGGEEEVAGSARTPPPMTRRRKRRPVWRWLRADGFGGEEEVAGSACTPPPRTKRQLARRWLRMGGPNGRHRFGLPSLDFLRARWPPPATDPAVGRHGGGGSGDGAGDDEDNGDHEGGV